MIPPGWLPDPQNPSRVRWWNGQTWTELTRPMATSNAARNAIIVVCILLGILFFIPLLGRRASNVAPPPTTKAASTAAQTPSAEDTDAVTMNDYLNVSEGMTYAQVVSITKVSGSEVSRSSMGDTEMVMYSWKNGRGRGSMTVMFRNDRLMTKSQFGLQ